MSHIFATPCQIQNDYATRLGGLLLDPAETVTMRAPGTVKAAVLIPLYEEGGGLHAVFTKRPADMRRHAGEISFPGGRRDDDEDLRDTALREAEEEIGLAREQVQVVGALPPTGTIVTNYAVYPFVGPDRVRRTRSGRTRSRSTRWSSWPCPT